MNLLEHQAYELLEKHGVKTPPWTFVKRDETPKLSSGRNYVAKIVDKKILHKSDCGGITFHVTAATAKGAHSNLTSKFKEAEGVLYVEEVQFDRSSEMIIGAYIDPFFGPLVTIGFGGTGTDFFGKVMKRGCAKAIIPASLQKTDVKSMLEALPIVKMVTGNVRGYKKLAKLDDLLSAVVSLQKLIATEHKGMIIEEIEVNPLVTFNGGLLALDGVCRLKERTVKPAKKPIAKIGNLLDPSSACIVGASGKNPANPANVILKNLLAAGLDRNDMFLIHPKEESIEDVRCTPTLDEMLKKRGGKPVDLLVIGVPAKAAADIIEESFKLNAANAIQVISAGFGETEGGKELQKRLENELHALDITPEKRPVMNGPNTLGNIYNGKRTIFTSPKKSSFTGKGLKNAALICQSGAYMVTAISDLANVIDPYASVSVGNQMDVTVVDCLEYLLNDKRIKTYGLYIEGLKDGEGLRLMELSKKAVEMGKFVIIYKAGRTKEGADAAKGHTAAMAGDYGMFEDLVTMSGAIVADTNSEFHDLLMMTAMLKPIKRTRTVSVAALSNAGFEKCAIADHLMRSESDKIKLAKYSNETIEKIRSIYEEHRVSGIMDIHDILDLTPMMNDDGYDKMIRATLADKNIGFGIYSIVPETQSLNICETGSNREESADGILARLIKIHDETDKPFVVSIESGWKYDKFAEKCLEMGIPCFRQVDSAARCVEKLLRSIL